MKIFFGSDSVEKTETAIALGDFDALHKGHVEIIKEAVAYASKSGISSAVYMFENSPKSDVYHINTPERRIKIIESLGVDICVLERFTESYKKLSCEEFVSEYIKKRLCARAVFVGFNYRFGCGASGGVNTLSDLCGENTKVFVHDCVKQGGEIISSSRIRHLVSAGDMAEAKLLTGRNFEISGRVKSGNQIGRKIGFPTANIEYPHLQLTPKEGVYVTDVTVMGKTYRAITNVGEKPTVGEEHRNIETAILDFHGDIYGKIIKIEFLKYIRDIKKFETLDALSAQLESDAEDARKF